MKNLVFINGTMGVGKTATSGQLLRLLPGSVFLDGDWCWNAHPFVVTNETKAMVQRNIVFLLNSFLACSAYQNIVFCWVMHEEAIANALRRELIGEYRFFAYSLVCEEEALKARLQRDIDAGRREEEVVARSLARRGNYGPMATVKIEVSSCGPQEAAQQIYEDMMGRTP